MPDTATPNASKGHPPTQTSSELSRTGKTFVDVTVTTVTTSRYPMTPRRWAALGKLSRQPLDVTAPAWIVERLQATFTACRDLHTAGLAAVDGNTYTITDTGRAAWATHVGKS
ncbi:hypothetical protein OG613_47285 (plasmid) [Streptomyces sp. NBC_00015]|uniref:hypothetical protein n=1 Tax=Streptomyces sp. NBC_00015 TaxID=2903611 RepID=UPI002F906B48